jgi:hypothetical protein
MWDGVLLLEISQAEVRRDLAKLFVFLEQLGDFGFVSGLVDLIGAVELLYVVHQSEQAVDLLLVLEACLLRAAEVHCLVH